MLLSLFSTFSYSFNLRKFRIKQEPDKDKLNFPLLFSFVQCYQTVSSQIGRITGNFTFSGSNWCWYVVIDQIFSDARAEQ